MTDISIEAIYDQLDNLELISFHGLKAISDKSIELLSQNENIRNNLKTLDIYGCTEVNNKETENLLILFPNLICFRYHF